MELLIIGVLALGCAYLGWRSYRSRQTVRRLTQLVQQDPTPSVEQASLEVPSRDLARLTREVLNLATECRLTAQTETLRLSFREALLDQIQDALFILDDNLEVQFSNRAARLLFPSDAPHTGRQLIEVCLDHRLVDTVGLAMEIGAKTQDQLRLRPPDIDRERPEHTYLVEAEPVEPQLGLGGGVWILIRDVTLQLETEQVRQDFIANASHELRTPLSIISGYIEMLEGEEPLDEAIQRRAVETMSKHCDRISRIVEDMLTISKLEGSDDLLSKDYFDIADCILDTIEHLQPIVDQSQTKITLDVVDEDRQFYGDPFYWDQIFFNLIENAIKQNRDRPLKIRIHARRDGGRYLIDVTDNGVGIPHADLPLIFKRFYRVEKHHAKILKGTGLGLSIVKRAVEAHHGTITAHSEPGRRTTFAISLPQPSIGQKESEPVATNGSSRGGA